MLLNVIKCYLTLLNVIKCNLTLLNVIKCKYLRKERKEQVFIDGAKIFQPQTCLICRFAS